jgi:hypothetical protein
MMTFFFGFSYPLFMLENQKSNAKTYSASFIATLKKFNQTDITHSASFITALNLNSALTVDESRTLALALLPVTPWKETQLQTKNF